MQTVLLTLGIVFASQAALVAAHTLRTNRDPFDMIYTTVRACLVASLYLIVTVTPFPG